MPITRRERDLLHRIRQKHLRDFEDMTVAENRALFEMVATWDLLTVDEAPEALARLDRGDSPFPRTAA